MNKYYKYIFDVTEKNRLNGFRFAINKNDFNKFIKIYINLMCLNIKRKYL